MLKLSGKSKEFNNIAAGIYSVSTDESLPDVLRSSKVFFLKNTSELPKGYQLYLGNKNQHQMLLDNNVPFLIVDDEFNYIGHRDIIKISNEGHIISLFRSSSKHNSFLVTEQCNHYCLMCSQPPKKIDDSYLLEDIKKVIPLIPKNTEGIGFTGGEPTLFGDDFLNVLTLAKNYLPETSVHILSNGRSFAKHEYVKKYAAIQHPDMMVGIPIYSDDPVLHDYIVQAEDAFDETIMGILNLKKLNQKVEIRVVIHKQSIKTLVSLSEYIVRNLLFVDHVALMGLEMMGFTRANLDKLWIDPIEYKDILSESVSILRSAGMNISVYNHQLCLVNEDILPFYIKSISDWKNEYAKECESCSKIHECGGFFSSGIMHKYSSSIRPFI